MRVPPRHIPSARAFRAQVAGLIFLAALSGPLVSAQATPAQTKPNDDRARQQAFELYHSGKFVEAMPLLEKLAVDYPDDGAVKESWAFSVMAYAATLSDPELRKKARVRARGIALQAKGLTGIGSLLQVVIDLPEDGADPKFSDRKEVDDVMKAAEADFVRGDLDKARDGYIHALLLDPQNHNAALFIGDVYFKQHVNGSAGEWFARAVQIDPDRETAYRYWGDALSDLGKIADAREKYIQAVIADPYNQRPWVGLSRWTERTKLKLNWIRLQSHGAVSQDGEQHINITLDADSLKKNDPSGPAWTAYSMNRALWQMQTFKKEFPNEPQYRRTMREEAESLHMLCSVMQEQKSFAKKKKDLDPALLQLVQIDQAGLLEPFVLLNQVDKDIAKDYVNYRKANREKLYRYLDEIVVPKTPAP